MEQLSGQSLPDFLRRRDFSVVHVDASWDGYRTAMAEQLQAIRPEFDQLVSFGYIDCDVEQQYASKIGVRNVPSVAYYRRAELHGLVIGVSQDVAANIERMQRGEALDQSNCLSRG